MGGFFHFYVINYSCGGGAGIMEMFVKCTRLRSLHKYNFRSLLTLTINNFMSVCCHMGSCS